MGLENQAKLIQDAKSLSDAFLFLLNLLLCGTLLQLEAWLGNLEGRELGHSVGSIKGKSKIEMQEQRSEGMRPLITAAKTHNPATDSVNGQTTEYMAEKSVEKQEKDIIPKKRKGEAKPSQANEARKANSHFH